MSHHDLIPENFCICLFPVRPVTLSESQKLMTHARTRARTYTRTHPRTHARTHAHTMLLIKEAERGWRYSTTQSGLCLSFGWIFFTSDCFALLTRKAQRKVVIHIARYQNVFIWICVAQTVVHCLIEQAQKGGIYWTVSSKLYRTKMFPWIFFSSDWFFTFWLNGQRKGETDESISSCSPNCIKMFQ